MAFPLSAQGEVVLTAADGKLPSADIAIGRLDAALSEQWPEDISRTPSSIRFEYAPFRVRLDPEWHVWNYRHRWDPDRIEVVRGSVEIEESADALRLRYELDHRDPVLIIAVLIVLVAFVRPAWQLELAAMLLIALIGLAWISSATARFRRFVRRAVLGRIKLGPDES